ncbi:MAG: sodium-dependent bicarbonate transport family permease [Phenylobacterium sp.]|uniref:sodium-dependent bicarbonate transport family permease n=1 Tax=Phenylobacterium sp. TaxID=1871053 RepID=UPI00271B33B6|nr:sodium-dependent bicarbonate transport family permease [Phenylobacterium sp.]MDO8910430.1 sodium-dependent bicarbonate transport family permease [Phenylobacterium sp.]MDP3102409.1 sodium-dependent bicarbonate transport family permease [Phenylobacterium sp.]
MLESAPGLALLMTPAVLFFLLGAGAAFAKSDLAVPEPVAKSVALYLMLCIGFKGGAEARTAGLDGDFLMAAGLGVALSALLPLVAYGLLKHISRLDHPTICAHAATYGSVSVVTFAAGEAYLVAQGLAPGRYMAAVLALMEAPAILTALLLLNRSAAGPSGRPGGALGQVGVMREVVFGAATVMLLGSFMVGLVSGPPGLAKLDVFVGPLFQGALCFFLLDTGLVAARRLMAGGRKLTPPLLGFAIGFPLLSAVLCLLVSRWAGLAVGDGALLAILAGSASYIAVPAAMRLAAPQADAGVYVTSSLAVTFPFNLTLGIAIYAAAATWIWR